MNVSQFKSQESTKLDSHAVISEALRNKKMGEDFEVALLRECKKKYGEKGLTAFYALYASLKKWADYKKNPNKVEWAARDVIDNKRKFDVSITPRGDGRTTIGTDAQTDSGNKTVKYVLRAILIGILVYLLYLIFGPVKFG